MLAVGAFWLAWMRTMERQTVARYGLMGVLVGVAALMRWQDGVLLLLPVIDALRHWRRGTTGSVAARLAAVAVGTLVGFAPANCLLDDRLRPAVRPAAGVGVHEMDRTGAVVGDVLEPPRPGHVDTDHRAQPFRGSGAAFSARSFHRFFGADVLSDLLDVNAAVADWWAGEAFGARRFLSCYPVFVLGLAALFNSWRSKSAVYAGITGAFVLYTLLLLVQYQAFMHGLRGVYRIQTPRTSVAGQVRSPFIILDWWLNRS